MARTFSTAKQLSSFVLHRISVAATCRRGYAAVEAAEGAVSSGSPAKSNATPPKSGNEGQDKAESSWYPDPVTGYYRPEDEDNKEMDAVELRQMFLKKQKPKKAI
ncbi:PREDICTED: protein SENESCENCE-ASSOCIATED GENE 21, mitochondrial-like [Ipomoea nil]|uniref:protein SENESCENCE-ASSOCIATED GENE 21, mitochondrial-like n=1 Tax=Ipomoea nil TaxID=35883 RepID=UPI0009012089|nr:PREDICTED: protein SENESCENCE-ASSOCIATED GENE 21, mitochondrial-like [Ipomoea nil]